MALFNIRVYGILIDEYKRILVSDEFIRGAYITKFPGGGLEFGEGTRDCLAREFKEETGLDVTIGEHLYTTDFYQRSAFNPQHQIISIYYFVHCNTTDTLITQEKPFEFTAEQIADPQGESEVFRWIEWNNFNEGAVSLPIDKVVANKLKEQKSKK